MYYSIVYCYLRDNSFQRQLLKAGVFQCIMDIVFYETTECIITQYATPLLARADVDRAVSELEEKINADKSSGAIINAPDYLFMSFYLSRMFPESKCKFILCFDAI